MTFFTNTWNWLVAQAPEITAIFTPSAFIALIVAIARTVILNKDIKKNTLSSNALSADLTKIDNNTKSIEELSAKIDTTNESIVAVKQDLRNVADKFNKLIEVFKVVYSTIKDDDVRTKASLMLADTKLSTIVNPEDINDVVEKIDEAKDVVKAGAEVVKEAATKVKKTRALRG